MGPLLRDFSLRNSDQVLRQVKDWCTGIPLYDDLTFVVMRVTKSEKVRA